MGKAINVLNGDIWKIKDIPKVVSRIPNTQVYFILILGLMGAILCLVGFFLGLNRLDADIDSIPEYIFL